MYKISRWEMFHEIEKDALMPLPVEDYSIRHFANLKIGFNYHIYLLEDKHYYRVPYQHRGKRAEMRYTSSTVEKYLKNRRVAIHKRDLK